MTKGEVCREDSWRAECVWRVVSVLSLFSPCSLSVLKMTPSNITLYIAALYYPHKTLKATYWSPLVLAPLRASNPNYF